MEYLTNHLLELIIILVFFILNIILLNKKITKNIYKIDFKDEYLIHTHILEQIIDNYKILILEEKITKLRKNYDIDPQSKTNSIVAYQKEYNKLLRQSSREVINHLSTNTRKKLLEYYTEDSLILHILNLLRS